MDVSIPVMFLAKKFKIILIKQFKNLIQKFNNQASNILNFRIHINCQNILNLPIVIVYTLH